MTEVIILNVQIFIEVKICCQKSSVLFGFTTKLLNTKRSKVLRTYYTYMFVFWGANVHIIGNRFHHYYARCCCASRLLCGMCHSKNPLIADLCSSPLNVSVKKSWVHRIMNDWGAEFHNILIFKFLYKLL